MYEEEERGARAVSRDGSIPALLDTALAYSLAASSSLRFCRSVHGHRVNLQRQAGVLEAFLSAVRVCMLRGDKLPEVDARATWLDDACLRTLTAHAVRVIA